MVHVDDSFALADLKQKQSGSNVNTNFIRVDPTKPDAK